MFETIPFYMPTNLYEQKNEPENGWTVWNETLKRIVLYRKI